MKLLREVIDYKNIEVLKEESKEPGVSSIFRLKGPMIGANIKNRNGRTYPTPIVEREVQKFNEQRIQKGMSRGELGHPECNLSNDFDVLTETGWKHFTALKENENILTLDENGNIEINPIEKLIDDPYEGDAYYIHGRNIDSAFTPGHRFLLKNRNGKLEYATIEEIYNNRVKFSHHTIVKTGNWLGNDVNEIVIPGISEEEFLSKKYWQFKNDVRSNLVIDALLFVQFLGIWLSEGSVSNTKYFITISQNKGYKADLIEEMLSKFPLKWNKYIVNDKKIVFSLADIRLWEYLSKLGDCYSKHVPFEIKQLSPIYLEELVNWFVLGDGRCQERKDGQIGRRNLFSVSKKLVEDLHECLIKSGGSGNWTEIDPCDDYVFADHLILAENKSTLYQLNISNTTNICLDARFMQIDKISYNGNVYCLRVKNSNFYMKENGKAFWTGNSPEINLDRVSHIIEKLYMDGDTAYGVAKLIDTPMGRIAQTLVKEKQSLGMSTRGVGTLTDDGTVKEDFLLCTIDLVDSPSFEKAMMEAVLENKEWIIQGDKFVEVAVHNLQKSVEKKYDPKSMSNHVLTYMMKFLDEIQQKKV